MLLREVAVGQPDDDEPEIEVAPLAAPLPRRPRVANPEVDNVIASGEIAPRSLVVRSTQPSIPPFQLPQPPPPRPARGWLWLVAALVPGLAVVILSVAKPDPAAVKLPTTDLEAVAELVGSTFDGDARAAQVRAEAIASSSMLRAGIETDPQTLDDMTRDKDVVFPISKAESVEVFQVHDATRTSLIRVPKQAAPSDPPAPGTARLEARGDVPRVVVNVPISNQAGAVAGELVLAAPVDLARIKAHLPQRALSAAITGFPTPIPLGGTATQAGQQLSLPIHTALATASPLMLATVIAAAPIADQPMWYRASRGIGAGLAALFVIIFLISLLVRRSNG